MMNVAHIAGSKHPSMHPPPTYLEASESSAQEVNPVQADQGWVKYSDPASKRYWYWNSRTEEAFGADDPQTGWQKYTSDPDSKKSLWWWHKETGRFFFDEAASAAGRTGGPPPELDGIRISAPVLVGGCRGVLQKKALQADGRWRWWQERCHDKEAWEGGTEPSEDGEDAFAGFGACRACGRHLCHSCHYRSNSECLGCECGELKRRGRGSSDAGTESAQ